MTGPSSGSQRSASAPGDVDAFEALFRQYEGEVVRHTAVAEELTIETFWRIYRQRQRFDAQRPFGPWARRIAKRVAIDFLRSSVESLELLGKLEATPPSTARGPCAAK